MQQLGLAGVPAQPEIGFNLYHDESGNYHPVNGSRWLIHGVLFVPIHKQPEIIHVLEDIRRQHGFYEELHYKSLRHAVKGNKYQCVQHWLQTYIQELSNDCFYYCLAIDTHSPSFQSERFGETYHAYNYFTRMAIVAGIAWFLAPYRRVALHFFSDGKKRGIDDNFATYLPRQVCMTIAEKRQKNPFDYPQIRLLSHQVAKISSNPQWVNEELRPACELIQLVDLLTSGVQQALTANSSQQAKVILAEMIAGWVEDTRRPPWLQTKELHRRFSLSCFPNRAGTFHDPTLAITTRNQLFLFENSF